MARGENKGERKRESGRRKKKLEEECSRKVDEQVRDGKICNEDIGDGLHPLLVHDDVNDERVASHSHNKHCQVEDEEDASHRGQFQDILKEFCENRVVNSR